MTSKFGTESEPMIPSSESETSPTSETCFNITKEKEKLSEELYCKTLGEILHHVKTPVIVGLNEPCCYRLSWFMETIENYLLLKTKRNANKKPTSWCGKQFYHQMLLLWKIAMCVPKVPDETETKPYYIFVPFQAWEFAGSDLLWAGLVTTLCGCIEEKYWLPLIFYKLFGIPVQNSTETPRKVLRRNLRRVLYFFLLLVFIIIIFYCFILDLDTSDTVKRLLIPGVPISIITAWSLGRGIYTFFRNSEESINKLMNNNTKCSNQLGFMHSVKEEVEVLIKFLCVLGAYKKLQIKVVLQISYLDACPPKKVMKALEALRILHSDPKAPFISILAADSKIIAESVERSDREGSLTGSGYQYLNQVITLPFSVPPMNKNARKKLLDEMKLSEKTDQTHQGKKRRGKSGTCNQNLEEGKNNGNPKISDNKFTFIIKYLQSDEIAEFLPNNKAHMAQVIYSSWITWELKKLKESNVSILPGQQTMSMEEEGQPIKKDQKQQLQNMNPESRDHGKKWEEHSEVYKEVISWVLLANEWPCRVSWLIQCAQDDKQWREIREHNSKKQQPTGEAKESLGEDNTSGPGLPEAQNSIKLEDSLENAFVKTVIELDSVKEDVKKLLELDGDPETFFQMLKFLKKHGFTVRKALDYWEITTNLDGSLKRYMELIRGSRTLKQAAICNQFLPLSLLKMSTEEVCQELEKKRRKWGISKIKMEQYKEKIKQENLSGRALVYSLNSEIRRTLGMTLGDWVSFSISFLNVLPEANSTLAATMREQGYGGKLDNEILDTGN